MNPTETLGRWIADHPFLILAAALLLTIASLHYAQQIEMQGMTTESMVGKDSPLYQLFDHLYAEKFATESIAVVIESDDITKPEILRAMDLLSQKMREAPNVLAVTSIADIVLETEERDFGLAAIPDQEDRVDQILSSPSNQPAVSAMMPDKKHTLLSIDLPVTLTEAQLREIYAETSAQVRMAEFPPHVVVTVTGEPALMQSITDEMAKSNGPIMAMAGLLMIIALIITFNHVKWSLLPIPIVFLGIVWTFGAMGFLHIPFTMISMSAFPVLIGIGIDYAIQFHNRIDEEFTKKQLSHGGGNRDSRPCLPAGDDRIDHNIDGICLPAHLIRAPDQGLWPALPGGAVLMLSVRTFCRRILCSISWRRRTTSGAKSKSQNAAASDAQKTRPSVASLRGVSDICIQRWRLVLAAALFLSMAGIYADTLVQVDTDFKNYVPQDLPPLIDFRHMSDIFGGTDTLDLIVQAG